MSANHKLTFPYITEDIKPFPSSKRAILVKRPIIPVTILYGSRLVQYAALLDTGADYNIFHGDIATYLGIKLTQGSRRNISGISGAHIKGYEHRVRLRIGDLTLKSTITFSNQLPDHALAVLGNQGFFNQVQVTFSYSKSLITISR